MITSKIKNSLSHKILFIVLAISFFGTLVITTFQLIRDYRQQVDTTQQSLHLINQSYSKSITNSLWNLDESQIAAQLDGILSLPAVDFIEIEEPGQEPRTKGTKPSESIRESFPLSYNSEGKDVNVGNLVLYADIKVIYQSITEKAIIIIFSQLFKTMLVSIMILLSINKMLTRPLIDIKDYLEGLDLSKKPKKLEIDRGPYLRDSHDELTILTNSINKMSGDLYNYTVNLEKIVEERTAQLNETNRNIQKILENIQQGIFTFGADLKVQKDYSSHLCHIMNRQDIAGQNAIELLLSGSNVNANDKNQIAASLGACVNDSHLSFELNSHLLPHQVDIARAGGVQILELEWDAIVSEQETIEKIMVVVKDVTELRVLQAKSKKQECELMMIGEILKIGVGAFDKFYASSEKYTQEAKELIDRKAMAVEHIHLLLRNMHTLKGNARTYGLTFAANEIHQAEQQFSDILKDPNNSNFDYPALQTGVDAVNGVLKQYFDVASNNLRMTKPDNDNKVVEGLLATISKALRDAQSKKSMDLLNQVIFDLDERVSKFKYKKLSKVIEPVVSALDREAKKLGKVTPSVVINDNAVGFLEMAQEELSNAMMHCLVNSLDHGIENPDERKAKNKNAQGRITIDVKIVGEKVKIIYQDDGKGLNLKRLREIGLERKLIAANASVKEIVDVIFSSGISTKEEVTSISGRGVGMSAVRKALDHLQGEIDLELGAQTGDWLAFKFAFTLPAEFVKNLNDQKSKAA